MAPTPTPGTPRRAASSSGTRSTRPKSASASSRRFDNSVIKNPVSEPPKKGRYVPGGPGGGGRYVDEHGADILLVGGTGPGGYNYVGPRGRIGRENAANGVQPVVYPRRENRTTRTRTVLPRAQPPPMPAPSRFGSSSQAAAAVAQSDGYKPREERSWEEFHPDLDITQEMLCFSQEQVEGLPVSRPSTPAGASQSVEESVNGKLGQTEGGEQSTTASPSGATSTPSLNGVPIPFAIPGTPGGGKRRPGRPPKNPEAFYAARAAASLGIVFNGSVPKTPKTPKSININNTNAKEKLTLPQPSFRMTNTLAKFDTPEFDQYVDKSMANVGYQESDVFIRPEQEYIKASDINFNEDLDGIGGPLGRVEYDMDEADDKWLQHYNERRKAETLDEIPRHIFEVTLTKIEKDWHSLERAIPKPNPKPPQTHRPRSSSAAAVNGEAQVGEEQDSKCAICDDGDCENTNAIVFCDGCDLAVHQECYGVPFIPEGQWMCRKCQLIGRSTPTCIFCPNTDGAFKQTNASKWSHLLCAMWIPEVSLGNTTFMEPVMEVEKVPKSRWKLNCYICNQAMGACVQCGNKSCFTAFHVTCARRARLFLKMKNNHGTLAILDGNTVLKAFCDKHSPHDHARENDTVAATIEARRFYKRTMRGRVWADTNESASVLAKAHRRAGRQPEGLEVVGAHGSFLGYVNSDSMSDEPPVKGVWKLPSGAPIIPKIIYNSVENSLMRYTIRKRKEWVADCCRYWTLKREARRGAALLKRLQLQMESFSSMEITRRNFSGMGHVGRERLARRIGFAQLLLKDIEKLRALAESVKERELKKLESARCEKDAVDTIYFPVAHLLPPVVEKALQFDIKKVFTSGLVELRAKLDQRFYTTTGAFVKDLSAKFTVAIMNDSLSAKGLASDDIEKMSTNKKHSTDIRERRKLGKRIIKAVQPMLEAALRAECDVLKKPVDDQLANLNILLESCLLPAEGSNGLQEALADLHGVERSHDDEVPDAFNANNSGSTESSGNLEGEALLKSESTNGDVEMSDVADHDAEDVIHVDSMIDPALRDLEAPIVQVAGEVKETKTNGITPPETYGYSSTVEVPQITPPTPPVSTGENPTESADVLNNGGILWYVKDFQPEGTSILQDVPAEHTNGSVDSEELSDMDEEDIKALADPEAGPSVQSGTPATKAKKAKSRKKWRGFK
ncbi:PHD-finger domain-containing protein [Rutstroemia sp. NJR-2017a WRK4]|nr:PHD-finger domain-containing protein [Rutstroemia sp. NJR-2017a WRK4]